jgi:hypothetical protein
MKNTQITKVTKNLVDAFKNATGSKEIRAVRQNTSTDDRLWYQEHSYVFDVDDILSRSITAPRNIWVDLTDKLITEPKLNVKVPFADDRYRSKTLNKKFTNYGSINLVSEDGNDDAPQTLYMPNNEIRALKALMKLN